MKPKEFIKIKKEFCKEQNYWRSLKVGHFKDNVDLLNNAIEYLKNND